LRLLHDWMPQVAAGAAMAPRDNVVAANDPVDPHVMICTKFGQ
jgi:hypothetical protein